MADYSDYERGFAAGFERGYVAGKGAPTPVVAPARLQEADYLAPSSANPTLGVWTVPAGNTTNG